MLKTSRAILTATLLSSVALVPVTVVAFVASADMAIAKSDKASGKGGGKGNSGKSASSKGGKSDSKWKKPGKGGGKDKASAKGQNRGMKGVREDFKQAGDDVKGLFNKLTGKKAAKPAKSAKSATKTKRTLSPAKTLETVEATPKARGGKIKGTLHPSNLGNMNGALNANENAIAAHIRNGNTNGPVGLMAAYVSARATTAEATEGLREGAEDYLRLNALLGDQTLDEYLEGGTIDPEIDALLADLNTSEQDRLLADAGYADLQAYRDAVAEDETLRDDLIETADPSAGFDADRLDEVIASEDALTAEEDAADALIAYWNKNGSAPDGTEDDLRDALETRAIYVEETASVTNALTPAEAEPSEDETIDADDDVTDDGCGDGYICPADEDVVILTD